MGALRKHIQRLLDSLPRSVQLPLRFCIFQVAVRIDLVTSSAEKFRREHFRGGGDEIGGELHCCGISDAELTSGWFWIRRIRQGRRWSVNAELPLAKDAQGWASAQAMNSGWDLDIAEVCPGTSIS